MEAPFIMMSHVTFGMLGVLAALAVFVDLLNLGPANLRRIQIVSTIALAGIVLSYISGGAWYMLHYGSDKAIIKAGDWPWAHSFVMEVKEHVFFLMLLLSFYLPMITYGSKLLHHRGQQRLALSCSGLIVLLGLAMEGAGALIAVGVRMGL